MALAVELNVEAFVGRFGVTRCGFLTLTPPDRCEDRREFQRRMNSLTSHVLRPRYGHAIRVVERMKSGILHAHLLVHVGVDILTGVDLEAFKNRDYRSAPKALRDEWAFWRATAPRYGLGRHELLPIISDPVSIGKYLGKYVAKDFGNRGEGDKGARLVNYIGGQMATARFAFVGGSSRRWRMGVGRLVGELHRRGAIRGASAAEMVNAFGRNWYRLWGDVIVALGRGVAISETALGWETGAFYGYGELGEGMGG